MRILCRKHQGGLHPIDEPGREVIARIKDGEQVGVEVKRDRNLKHHRKYMALIRLVWENLDGDRYPTVDLLNAAIKCKVGHYDPLILNDGTIVAVPRSIAFDKMEQGEFDQFYNRVCDKIAQEFLPGVTSETLKAEVENLIGITREVA